MIEIDETALRALVRDEIEAAGLPAAETRLLLTVPEAAQLLNMGKSTAYQRIREGSLRAVLDGDTMKVPRDAVEEYAAGLRSARSPVSKPRKSKRSAKSNLPASDPASW